MKSTIDIETPLGMRLDEVRGGQYWDEHDSEYECTGRKFVDLRVFFKEPSMKQRIEIDVPEGMEVSAVKEFRDDSREGEWVTYRAFFRPAWTWPFIWGDWCVTTACGSMLIGIGAEPSQCEHGWKRSPDSTVVHVSYSQLRLFGIKPPCDDWRTSLRRNPNAETR